MFGKRIEQLNGIAARLEAVAARLDRQDGIAVEQAISPAVAAEMVRAVDECLTLVFGAVEAAVAAGERDQTRLVDVATKPLIRALGAAPPAQQTSAARTALWNIVSLLVARIQAVHQPRAHDTEARTC